MAKLKLRNGRKLYCMDQDVWKGCIENILVCLNEIVQNEMDICLVRLVLMPRRGLTVLNDVPWRDGTRRLRSSRSCRFLCRQVLVPHDIASVVFPYLSYPIALVVSLLPKALSSAVINCSFSKNKNTKF